MYGIFGINSVWSSIVIYTHYVDSKTITIYLTDLMFVSLKVLDVYNPVNTKPNIFYNAYLKNKVQFNGVDPDKIILIEDVETKDEPRAETRTESNTKNDEKI